MLQDSSALTELNLDDNGIGPEVPGDLLLLTSLKTLTLRNNKLERVPLDLLRAVPNLDMQDNPVSLEMYLECELEDKTEEASKRAARRKALECLGLGPDAYPNFGVWAAWQNLDMPRGQDLLRKARKYAVVAGGGARVWLAYREVGCGCWCDC